MRKISCVMATMNRQQFIKESVDSILGNGYENIELIIIDSGDSIKNLLPDDKRIIYIKAPNASCTEAMNIGMRKSTGDILVMTNDDDNLKPGTLLFIDKNLTAEWCYGVTDTINEKGALISYGKFNEWNYETMKYGNFIPQPAAFWTRKIYNEFGVLDTTFNFSNDYEYWMRIGATYKPQTFDKVLAEYRLHSKAISSERRNLQRRDAEAVSKRYRYVHASYESRITKVFLIFKDLARRMLRR